MSANATTGASTLTLRKNGGNGNQTITIPAGQTGLFRDTTHTDAVAVSDLINGQVVVGAGGTLTFTFVGVGFKSTLGAINDIGAQGTSVASATFFSPIGFLSSATESAVQIVHGFPAALSRLGCLVTANTCAGTSTVNLRINGVNGNQVLSIGAGATGWFTDTTHTDQLGAADKLAYEVSPNTGSLSIVFFALTEHATTVANFQASTTPVASIARARPWRASTTPIASLARGKPFQATTTPLARLTRVFGKQLSQDWKVGKLFLTDYNPALTNTEDSIFYDPYFIALPHDTKVFVRIDARTRTIVDSVDISASAGAGYWHGGVIFGSAVYLPNYEHSGVVSPYIGRMDLSNWTFSGYSYVDITTVTGLGTGLTESAGPLVFGPDGLGYYGAVDFNVAASGKIIRFDPSNFDAAHVAYVAIGAMVPNGLKGPGFFGADARYVYGDVIVGPTERYMMKVDTTVSLTTAAVTLGPMVADKLGTTPVLANGHIFSGPITNNDGSLVPFRQWDPSTLAVVATFDPTPWIGTGSVTLSVGALDPQGRYAYWFVRLDAGPTVCLVFDTLNPGIVDGLTPELFDGALAGQTWSSGQPFPMGPYGAMMTSFTSPNGLCMFFRQKMPTDSYGKAGPLASMVRTTTKAFQGIANAIASRITGRPFQASTMPVSSALHPAAFAAGASDAGSASDAPSSTATIVTARTEAGAAGDVLDAAVAFATPTVDAGSASDADNARVDFAPPIAEAGSAGDASSTAAALASAQLEAGAGADTITSTANQGVSQADAGAAADAPSSVATLPSAAAESGAAADAGAGGALAPSARSARRDLRRMPPTRPWRPRPAPQRPVRRPT